PCVPALFYQRAFAPLSARPLLHRRIAQPPETSGQGPFLVAVGSACRSREGLGRAPEGNRCPTDLFFPLWYVLRTVPQRGGAGNGRGPRALGGGRDQIGTTC